MELYERNSKRYQEVWAKVPDLSQDWDYDTLKHRLKAPEYYFLVVSMYYGVRSNGGAFHALCCYLDKLDLLVEALEEVKAAKEAELIRRARAQVLSWGLTLEHEEHSAETIKGFDDSHYGQMEALLEKGPFESDDDLDRLLDAHWLKRIA